MQIYLCMYVNNLSNTSIVDRRSNKQAHSTLVQNLTKNFPIFLFERVFDGVAENRPADTTNRPIYRLATETGGKLRST